MVTAKMVLLMALLTRVMRPVYVIADALSSVYH